nr:aldehyde dehydrogenase family protein [Saprospiraceae bacterium]
MDINQILTNSSIAFQKYNKLPGSERAHLLESMADEIEALGDQLIKVIGEECNLPEGRVLGERGRTCGQLRMFAQVARTGSHLGIRKDQALPDRTPLPRPDLRKINIPIGPIVVFGASNFPLAYSTAGGDTASALAAGCTVVLKAHPGHPRTSAMVASALQTAIKKLNMDPDIFIHVEASDFETGKALVQHPLTAG